MMARGVGIRVGWLFNAVFALGAALAGFGGVVGGTAAGRANGGLGDVEHEGRIGVLLGLSGLRHDGIAGRRGGRLGEHHGGGSVRGRRGLRAGDRRGGDDRTGQEERVFQNHRSDLS